MAPHLAAFTKHKIGGQFCNSIINNRGGRGFYIKLHLAIFHKSIFLYMVLEKASQLKLTLCGFSLNTVH